MSTTLRQEPRRRSDVPMRTTRIVPFAACALIGFATLLAPPYNHDPIRLVLSGALIVLVVGSAIVLPWERWPRWAESIPPLAFFVVILVMRDASGGSASALAVMVALPVLWLALFGDRTSLWLAALATAAVFIVPVVLIGEPAYPLQDWRRGALWVAIAVLVGPSIQAVVRLLERREREQTALNTELEEAGRQWTLFADQLPDTVVLVVDHELRYRQIAGAGAMRQGIEGWLGKTLLETSSPQNIAVLEPLYRAAHAGRTGTCELASTLRGATHQVTVVPFEYHGEAAAMVVARDVTLAQRREAEIRALSDQVGRMVDEAPTGICLCDLDGRVVRVNDTLVRLLDLGPGVPAPGATLATLGLLLGDTDPLELTRSSPKGHWADEVRVDRGGPAPLDLALDLVTLYDADGHPESLLVHVHDISERRRFEERLEHLAAHDPLTGLANRRRFDEVLGHHLKDGARYGLEGVVLMLDLDHFKEVNDTFGHDVGDQLIVSVASTLRNTLRDSDTIARLGGDEFAILLPRGGHESAERACERIVTAIREHAAALEPRAARPISASVGAVVLHDSESTVGEILIAADMTMYDAKDAGRDRYAVFDATDHGSSRTASRIGWATRIRQALREDRFVLHAQPVYDLSTREVVGAELLLRMVDDDGSLVGPGRFLYIAERMGLAPQVDLWVVRQGVEHLAELTRRGRPLRLSINVSASSLNDLTLIEQIEQLVTASGVEPSHLVFEITETAAIANMERARSFARRIHDLGSLLALDDFGAGHGSFYYLKHLPFDYVKIDGEFVRSCTTNEFDRLVIESVVTFSVGAGRKVVAEYVVDEPTAELLRTMSVDHGQGFHLARPEPWERFLEQTAPQRDTSPTGRE